MSTSLNQIWFGIRAVDHIGPGPAIGTSQQLALLDELEDFATMPVHGDLFDKAGIQFQQVLAFVGTADQQAALGIDLTDGVDAPTPGDVNTTGDLLVGEGVVAHNIADSNGGTRLTNTSGIDRSDDPVTISGHGKLNNAKLTGDVLDGWVSFSNDLGFGLINGSGWDTGGNSTRLNDGDSVTFDVADGSVLSFVSFTVSVLNGGSTHVVLDSDGRTIADTNADLQGGFVQDASAGELDLGVLDHGAKVEIDYALAKIFIDGVELGAVGGFFTEALANGGDKVTFGSMVGNNTGWSVDDLVLTVADAPDPGPGLGVLSLDLFRSSDGDPAPAGLEDNHLYAYLDADENNVMDLAEAVNVEDLGDLNVGYETADDPSGDGDDNPVQGETAGTDWLDMYALGWANSQVASGHQYGEHLAVNWTGADPGTFALGINTARDSAIVTPGGPNGSPDDIEAGPNTYQDGAETPEMELGEVLGFVLKSLSGVSATITYGDAEDFTPTDDADIIVRLYQDSTLIETIEHDITAAAGSFTVADDLGAAFNRMEIQAAGSMDGIMLVDAGARFTLTDLDIVLGS